MDENKQETKGLFDMFEENIPAYGSPSNSQLAEGFAIDNENQLRIEFLIQDMFLDHFFP